jgi:monoamine oxidase
MPHADVIVIGAGAAGLSASRELSRAGARVTLLEAKARPGGRILTEHAVSWSQPIELGAEFVHDVEPEFVELTEQAELTLDPIVPEHLAVSRRAIEPAKELEHVEALLQGAEELDDDCTALELLAASEAGEATARWFTHFIEGFHGAPIDRVSARSVAHQGLPRERQFRIHQGYGALARYLERDAEACGTTIIYRTPVREVRRHGAGVDVMTDGASFHGDTAIVALPLSILRARPKPYGIIFEPEQPALRAALGKFEMGHAIRIVIRLREPPRLLERLPQGAFLHAPEQPVPTFWTGPERDEPQLTGWCGGPKVERWRDVNEHIAAAMASLSRILGMSQPDLERIVLRAHVHDFGHDPHARGAYPYEVPLHGSDPHDALPGHPPLVLAGDYLDSDAIGTVGAAVRSGFAAARAVLDGA